MPKLTYQKKQTLKKNKLNESYEDAIAELSKKRKTHTKSIT